MNKLLLLSFGFLSTLSTVALAEETKVSNVANSELCLIGDSNGLCSEGDERSPFFNQRSILSVVAEDLNRSNGTNGRFQRVSDDEDQLFKKSKDAGTRNVLVRVRSRYQGAPYALGIINGSDALPGAPYRRYVAGHKFSTRGKVFLKSCAGYQPMVALGKTRCAEFDGNVTGFHFGLLADSSMTEIELNNELVFQFALERVSDLTDVPASLYGLNTAITDVNTQITEKLGNRRPLISSLPGRNEGKKDQMVTFRFSEKLKSEDGRLVTTYLLAFNDNAAQADAQFNDYVVEVQFVEPTQAPRNEPIL